MNARRWIVLAALAALLAAVQGLGLDRSEEMRAEAPMRQFKGLPASDILPTYVASLFFGAFRAVAVDVLWIQLKRVEEERRWYERREILRLISYFQPRNPEVWATLGWHSAYNVANGFTDPGKSWEWTEFGLRWLRRGIRSLPNDAYLKHQLAYTLMHKPSWRDGALDVDLLRRIRDNRDLQDDLAPDDVPKGVARSAFELAALWLERGRVDLEAAEAGLTKTQMGLYLYPSTMDGFIRRCFLLEGTHHLVEGRTAEAKDWFRRADRHVQVMLQRPYKEARSPIFNDYAKLYPLYPGLVDRYHAARGGGLAEQLAFLKEAQPVAAEFGRMDEGLWWRPWDREAPLNDIKRRATKDRDPQEFNDAPYAASPLRPGDLAAADLDPPGLDVDVYAPVLPRATGAEPPNAPIRVKLSRPEGAAAKLKVTLLDGIGKPVKTLAFDVRGEARIQVSRADGAFLRVEPDAPPGGDTRYRLQIALEE